MQASWERLRAGLDRLVRDAEVRLNRPLRRREADAAFLREWGAETLAERLAGLRPELLVTVTTYRRPDELARLAESLRVQLPSLSTSGFVCVFNDRSDTDCRGARAALMQAFGDRCEWLDAGLHLHLGKRGFWRTYQTIMLLAKAAGSTHLLALQDDIEPVPDFGPRLRSAWEASAVDVARRVLYLCSHADDEEDGRWVRFRRVGLPGGSVRRTDWFDLQGFMIDRRGLALLRYWVVPIPARRWLKDASLSSGVGRQLTKRLFGRGAVYQCEPTLLWHGASDSEMNPQARSGRALDNRAAH
jgi:hypothetical protein